MTPAHNLEAERGVLGAMLIDPFCVAETCATLVPEDFFDPKHVLAFRAIQGCAAKLIGIDYVSVGVELQAMQALPAVGGRAFLVSLTESVTSSAHVRHHARIVKDASRLRAWAHLGAEAIRACSEAAPGSDSSEETQGDLTKRALAIGAELHAEPEPLRSIARTVAEGITAERAFENIGLQTGLVDLDRQLCGLRGGDFIVLAARPGMGKTALATTILANAMGRGLGDHALFASCEMGRQAIVERMLCARAGVSLHRMRKYGPTPDERRAILDAEADLGALPITINDQPAITPMALRGMAQRVLHKQRRLSLIIVDYLQLMRVPKLTSRYDEVSEVSRSLKQIAREMNVPVIALSQLSRQVEMRQEKIPVLADLRESGSIEQDADLVLFLYRAAYYDDSVADRSGTDIILAKNRNGPTGKVTVNFDPELMRFTDRTKQAETWHP